MLVPHLIRNYSMLGKDGREQSGKLTQKIVIAK